jgi:hypothetical protein
MAGGGGGVVRSSCGLLVIRWAAFGQAAFAVPWRAGHDVW